MAAFRLKDYIDFDTDGYITSVSWQAALDPAYTQIIDESLHDPINKLEWVSTLPVIGSTTGECYADLNNVYARVKIHMTGADSPWYEMIPKNQNDQTITYHELNGTTTVYNTIVDNIN